MEHIDNTDGEALQSDDQSCAWTVEDTIYALAMHINLDWKELNILSGCTCTFPNVPNQRCIVCERKTI